MMSYEEFIALINPAFPDLSDLQKEQFRKMEALYLDWNSKINVISRKDMDSFYKHHVLHSLAVAYNVKSFGGLEDGSSVLDLGTGGGFPGIPLAIMFPSCRFTLCDSIGKKILVAGSVASELGLANVKTVNARAESLPDKYDYVVSRAVTSLDNFYPWVKGRFKKEILYLKGGDVNVEIAAMAAKCKVNPASVSAWPIVEAIKDEYFDQKYVIRIKN